MHFKERPTRWFCVDCGFKAPKRYEPSGCPECGTQLIRAWIGPLEDERATIEESITAHRDPTAVSVPLTLNGLLWLLDRKRPLFDDGKIPLF